MKKSQMYTVVSIIIALIGFSVIAGIIHQVFREKKEIYEKENACLIANRLAQSKDVALLHKLAMKACATIDLGDLPMEGYNDTKEGVLKNIADKSVKTLEIWLDGTKDNLFDSNYLPMGQEKCFIQYTFGIHKNKHFTQIKPSEIEEFMVKSQYKIGDSSDRCAGVKGGFCSKDLCAPGEKREKVMMDCPSDKPYCCLKEQSCESRGGTCRDQSNCFLGEYSYFNADWSCNDNKICCIGEQNYLTYMGYLQANGAFLALPQEGLYTQDSKKNGKDFAETYAIVIVSRTGTWLSWERLGACAAGLLVGGKVGAVGGAGASVLTGPLAPVAAPFTTVGGAVAGGMVGCATGAATAAATVDNSYAAVGYTRVLIAPLNKVQGICAVQTGDESS